MNDFLDRFPGESESVVIELAGHRLVMWARWQEALRNAVRTNFNPEATIYSCPEAMTEVISNATQ